MVPVNTLELLKFSIYLHSYLRASRSHSVVVTSSNTLGFLAAVADIQESHFSKTERGRNISPILRQKPIS